MSELIIRQIPMLRANHVGTPKQRRGSLGKFETLPPQTRVFRARRRKDNF